MPEQPSDAPTSRAAARARAAAGTGAVDSASPGVAPGPFAPTTTSTSSDFDVIAALRAPAYAPVPESPPDDASGLEPEARTSRHRSEHVARTDWRLGGRTVFRWREGLLAIALVSLGIGVLAGVAVGIVWQSPWAPVAATALVGLGMLVPAVVGFSRSRPIGLLRFRALDLLYGVVLGGMLRLVQGTLAAATGNAAWPTYPLVDAGLGSTWLLADGAVTAVVAPLVEEFFFRGILFVALYTVLRRPLGRLAAAATTVLVTSGAFVLVHALSAPAALDEVVGIGLLGLVCGLLVMLTGRIWGAVLVHIFYNASFVLIALVGTLLG